MPIRAEIVADSIRRTGYSPRITSFILTYPRFIHSEVMTHRVFSRNSASSRAIPIEKMIDAVMENPAMPLHWGANQRGMQAHSEIFEVARAEMLWLEARDKAVDMAWRMHDLGLHKQVVNRILEPFMWMTVLVTSTDYSNFLHLRDHPDAQPEIQVLAREMRAGLLISTPTELEVGQWHLPFGLSEPSPQAVRDPFASDEIVRSVARAARVSYTNHGKTTTVDEDRRLVNHLYDAGHWSPFEHQAIAMGDINARSGNLKGFVQLRQLVQ